MPAKPAWFHRLPEISEWLRATDSPFLDRRMIEKLFEIRPRRAQLLMRSLSGYRLGNLILVDRLALLAQIEELARGEAATHEQRRRIKVIDALELAKGQLAGRRIRIPAASDVGRLKIADLPAGVRLKPGELRIEFEDPEDLLRRLFELSQAILNDYQRFETAAGSADEGTL